MALRIAYYGGSFNPLHLGHVALVQGLIQEGFDRIILVPTNRSPFKLNEFMLPNPLRLAMLKNTFQYLDQVQVSELEINQKGLNYTYDTLQTLNTQYPFADWSLVMGSDALAGYPKWKNSSDIIDLAELVVISRGLGKNAQEETLMQLLKQKWWRENFPDLTWQPQFQKLTQAGKTILRWLDFSTPVLSSSEIRRGLKGIENVPIAAQKDYLEFLNTTKDLPLNYEKS